VRVSVLYMHSNCATVLFGSAVQVLAGKKKGRLCSSASHTA